MEVKALPQKNYSEIASFTKNFYAVISDCLKDSTTLEKICQQTQDNAEKTLKKARGGSTQPSVTDNLILNSLTLQLISVKSNSSKEDIRAFQIARETQEKAAQKDRSAYQKSLNEFDMYFLQLLNDSIDNEKLNTKLQEITYYLSNHKNLPREHAIALINGFTLAGKNTAMQNPQNNIDCIETGTEGIVGHTGNYERWEEIMNIYDIPRTTSAFYPDNLMMLAVAIELQEHRKKLDEEEKFDKPVFISGFPRTKSQVEFLANFKEEQIVPPFFFTLNRHTALIRTLFRMYQDYTSLKKELTWRDDDYLSITTENSAFDVKESLHLMFNYLYGRFGDRNFFADPDLRKEIELYAKYFRFTLSKDARWHKDNDRMKDVIDKMSSLFPNLAGRVVVISVDKLTPEAQAAALREFLDRNIA